MMRRLLVTGAMVAIALLAGCESRGTDTRTYDLAHLDPESALMLIEPYVPGGAGNIRRTTLPAAVTVTATSARLDQIEELLGRYDVAAPDVRLRFQLIEADGFTDADPAIADVDAALRELFRFQGYRLAAEAMVVAKQHTSTTQRLLGPGNVLIELAVAVGQISSTNGRSSVDLNVALSVDQAGDVLRTGVIVPGGQTVVLGTARPLQDRGALILVVRPVIE